MKRSTPKTDTSPLSGPLRRALVDSSVPLLALQRETGVKRASIARFLRGKQSLRLDMADKLAAYFGLQLVKRKAK